MVERIKIYMTAYNYLRTLKIGALLIVVAVTTWFVVSLSVSANTSTLISENNSDKDAQLEALLSDIGYTPDSFASIAVSSNTVASILDDVAEWKQSGLQQTLNAQSNVIDAKIAKSRMYRSILRGRGQFSPGDYEAQVTAINTLDNEYQNHLDSLRDVVEDHLNNSQITTIAQMITNRSWEVDPKYQVLSLDESEWLVLRQFCNDEEFTLEKMATEDRSLINTLHDNNDLILASARHSTNKATISATWSDFWDNR